MVEATVNGERRALAEETTVADLLRELGLTPAGIAVAVNERVLRSAAFAQYRIGEGDAVEIIRAVAGG